jgi:two-component system, cell cycle sensor histidine kinase and response regulator CckA
MKPLLRALIVEDSENDTVLLLRNLERSDFEIAHQRVETAEALGDALDKESWDILFCDFTMPSFNGLRALEIVKERNIDLPFIFVSGTLGEDVAVQAMKEGTHDYVMKNNLARLVPAMERELREAKVRRLRREAEEDMRVSEYKYRHLFESLADAAFLIDKETGKIIDTNPQAEILLGRPRAGILGMKESQLFPPRREPSAVTELLSAEGGFESNVLQKNGEIVPVYVSVSRLQLYDRRFSLALFRDITGRKRSEEKIQEQANLLELAQDAIFARGLDEKIQYWNKGAEQLYERLELIGTLTTGIAHDLNNILQILITNLDLATSAPAFDEHLSKYLDDAIRGADRATNLAKRLLSFSKGGVPVKQSLDVAETLTPAVLLALSGSQLQPLFDLPPDLYPVFGDSVQLTQVIENIVVNACEATPQKGKLLVRAENIDEKIPSSFELPVGRYVKIEIEDHGVGIPDRIRERIFEFCFTTKPCGSGLGLATVKSIMQQHGGSVAMESIVGHGTTVSLLLPAAARRPAPTESPMPSPVVKTTGRILVIDDDEMILGVVDSMLNTLGYHCAVAKDGVEGCDMYLRAKVDGTPFAAVLLDATIPNGLAGEEALKFLLQGDADARVILFSGYTESDLFKEAEHLGFRAVLPKPFSKSEFVAVFNKVLL